MGRMRQRIRAVVTAGSTLAVAVALALGGATAANASAAPVDPVCAGNGVAKANIVYGLSWDDGSSNGWRIITQGLAVPNAVSLVLKVSTDTAQQNVVSVTSITPPVTVDGGMFRAETVVSAGITPATQYYLSVAVNDASGQTVACTPLYAPTNTPAGGPTTETPLSGEGSWLGGNPYNGYGFSQIPSAPAVSALAQNDQSISADLTIDDNALWSSVQYSTDGGTTWATAQVTSASIISAALGSMRTQSHAPTVVPAFSVRSHSSANAQRTSMHARPIEPRLLTVSFGTLSNGGTLGSANYSVQFRGVNTTPGGSPVVYGTASAAQSVTYGLPHTGTSVALPLGIAGLASLLGIGLFMVARARRAKWSNQR